MSNDESNKASAPRWKNLGVRAVSALLFAAFCFPPFYFGGYIWLALILALTMRVLWEWVRMSDSHANGVAYGVALAGAVTVFGAYVLGSPKLGLMTAFVVSVVAMLERLRRGGAQWAGLGFLYVIIPALCLVFLRGDEVGLQAHGFQLLIYLICVVIAADTFAYFGGSYFGGPKMAPKLSPKKTWSGFISGMVGAGIIGGVLAQFIWQNGSQGAIIAVLVGVVSVIGDFFESALKRQLNVKDAGGVLPGHGGLLDRLDSLMMVVFVVVLFGWLFPQNGFNII